MNFDAHPDTIMTEGFLFSITKKVEKETLTYVYRIQGPANHMYVAVTEKDNAVRYYNNEMDYIGFKPLSEFNTILSMLVESIRANIGTLV